MSGGSKRSSETKAKSGGRRSPLRRRLAGALDLLEDNEASAESLLERARTFRDEGRFDEAEALAHEYVVRCSVANPQRSVERIHQGWAVLAQILVVRGNVRLAGHLGGDVLGTEDVRGIERLRVYLAMMRVCAIDQTWDLFKRLQRTALRIAEREQAMQLYEDALAAMPTTKIPVPASFEVTLEHQGATTKLIEVWPLALSVGAEARELKQAMFAALTPVQLAAAVVDTPTVLPHIGVNYHVSLNSWVSALADLQRLMTPEQRREFAEALVERCLSRDVQDANVCLVAVYCLMRSLDADELLPPKYDILVWRLLSQASYHSDWIIKINSRLSPERSDALLLYSNFAVNDGELATQWRSIWGLLEDTKDERVARRALDLVDTWHCHFKPNRARELLWDLRAYLLGPLTDRARAYHPRDFPAPLRSTLEALDGPEVLEFWKAEFLAEGKAAKDALEPSIGARVAALHHDEDEAIAAIEALFFSKRWGRSGRAAAVDALAGRNITPTLAAFAERLASTKRLAASTRHTLHAIARRLPSFPRFSAGEAEAARAHISALIAREADDATLSRRPTEESWAELVRIIERCDASLRADLIEQAQAELEAWPASIPSFDEDMRGWLRDDLSLHSAPLIRVAAFPDEFRDVYDWESLIEIGLFARLDTLDLSGLALDEDEFDLLLDAEVFRGVRRVQLSCAFADGSYALRLLHSGQLDQCRELQIDVYDGEDRERLISALAGMSASFDELALVGDDDRFERDELERVLAARPLANLVLEDMILDHGACELLAATSSLRRLCMPNCGLSDAQVHTLSSSRALQQLEQLDLSWNDDLTGESLVAITAIAGWLDELQHLKMNSVGLDAADLERWAAAPGRRSKLRKLELSGCAMAGAGARSLFATPWPLLDMLVLDEAELGDEGLEALARHRDPIPLEVLSLVDNDVRGPGLAALMGSRHIYRLRRLDLSGNPLAEGDGLARLGRLASSPLEELYLARCQLRARYAGVLEALGGGTVHTLHIDSTDIGTEGLCALASSPGGTALRWLRLHVDDLSRRAMRFLASSPYLSEHIKNSNRERLEQCETQGPGDYSGFTRWP